MIDSVPVAHYTPRRLRADHSAEGVSVRNFLLRPAGSVFALSLFLKDS